MNQPRLSITPLSIREANQVVIELHRTHKPVAGGIFAIGCAVVGEDELVGAAIIGRPVAFALQDGFTAEVTRVATDGTPNACSCLYGDAWRACRAMGYRKLVTYTKQSEPGTSVRAAGFELVAEVAGREWDSPSRPRESKGTAQDKFRWERTG